MKDINTKLENKKDEKKEIFEEKSIKKEEFEDFKNSYKYIEELKINIPLDLKIDNYLYHYKYIKKVDKKVTYRCKYATSCKVFISIDLENMNKIINNQYDENTQIFYKYNNNNKHTCEEDKENTSKKIFIQMRIT